MDLVNKLTLIFSKIHQMCSMERSEA